MVLMITMVHGPHMVLISTLLYMVHGPHMVMISTLVPTMLNALWADDIMRCSNPKIRVTVPPYFPVGDLVTSWVE